MGRAAMDLLYLDYNCFQRGFDDPSQIRIRMEAIACEELFLRVERGRCRIVWSFMHEDETNLCPFPERIDEIRRLASLCNVRLGPEEGIYPLAKSIQESANIAAKDAVHLACAFYIQADYFISCDDQLLSRAQRLNPSMKVINPVDYIIRGQNNG